MTEISVRIEIATDIEPQRYVPHLVIPQNVSFHRERLTENYRTKNIIFSYGKYDCLQNILLESDNIFLYSVVRIWAYAKRLAALARDLDVLE